MLNKIPLVVIILVIIFLISSLFTIISINKVVSSEKIGFGKLSKFYTDAGKPPKTESAMVVIDIVNPNQT